MTRTRTHKSESESGANEAKLKVSKTGSSLTENSVLRSTLHAKLPLLGGHNR
jgi:hypothetical protein